MNFMRFMPESTAVRAGSALVLVAVLAACSGTSKPKPAELPTNASLIGVRQAWSVKIPAVKFPLTTDISGDIVTVAAADGTVVGIDARAGRETWRASVGAPLAAVVGSDGSITAVVTTGN